MILLDGKRIAKKLRKEVAEQVVNVKKQGRKVPHLAAVLVGSDGASLTYVTAKMKACDGVGFDSTFIKLPENTTEEGLLEKIEALNNNKSIDGFIVQLPLPKHIDEKKILTKISPEKDVDGFHPINVGKMILELPTFLPATPYGIMELLAHYKINVCGKNIVVIGRSHIVGRPMSILLSQKRDIGNATVTLVHSYTKDIKSITKQADIIVAALGVPKFLKSDMVKKGVTIIDAGTTRIADNTKKNGFCLVGDVDFDQVATKANFITPVPGGVGPMTIAMLLKNTLNANVLSKI